MLAIHTCTSKAADEAAHAPYKLDAGEEIRQVRGQVILTRTQLAKPGSTASPVCVLPQSVEFTYSNQLIPTTFKDRRLRFRHGIWYDVLNIQLNEACTSRARVVYTLPVVQVGLWKLRAVAHSVAAVYPV